MSNPSQAVLDLRRAFQGKSAPDWPEVRTAILAGAPIDTTIPAWSGATPLFIATITDNATEVGWLLDHGAALESVNQNGETALVRALAHSHTATIDLLLARGADPNVRNLAGWTVLMMVDTTNDAESAKSLIVTLLDHAADPAATTPDGCTAPEFFMAISDPEMTGYLDEAMADDRHAEGRRRLLNKLTADQRMAWLPKSSIAEAAMKARKGRRRTS